MRKLIVSFVFVAVPAFAQEGKESGKLTDPVEILKKADLAAKEATSLRYEAKFEGVSDSAKNTPTIEGKSIIDGEVNGRPRRWLYEVKVTLPDSAETRTLTAGSDGDNFCLIDHDTKKMYVDIDPAVLGSSGNLLQAVLMLEFVHETPFADELKGDGQEFKGVVEVEGEDCYQVDVNYEGTGASQVASWYFSTKDFLPRRVDRSIQGRAQGRRDTRMVLRSLKLNPDLEKVSFIPKLPEGYEKIDDFAP
jgi:outer membrane lipoprotein-sorting protein